MYHCDYCNCPMEYYEPLKNYPCDKGCELYSDFLGIIWDFEEEKKPYTFNDILDEMNKLSSEYPDIADFKPVTKEMIEINLDLGAISRDLYRPVTDCKIITLPCSCTTGEGR